MKVLITGIYGFLGSNLANELCSNHDVFGLYNTSKNKIINDSITTFAALEEISFSPDAIVMCHAAINSGTIVLSDDELKKTNVLFTKKILDYFPNVRVIYISSVSVFGNTLNRLTELSVPNPENNYSKSKLEAEKLVLTNKSNNVIRLSSLYGIGMKENTLIPNYCNQAIKNNKIEVWGNGSRKQNYIHIEDAIDLIVRVIQHKKNINFPILGVDKNEYSNTHIAEIIASKTNSKIEYVGSDNSFSYFYDNKLTQEELNWDTKIELKEGITNYLEWKEKQF